MLIVWGPWSRTVELGSWTRVPTTATKLSSLQDRRITTRFSTPCTTPQCLLPGVDSLVLTSLRVSFWCVRLFSPPPPAIHVILKLEVAELWTRTNFFLNYGFLLITNMYKFKHEKIFFLLITSIHSSYNLFVYISIKMPISCKIKALWTFDIKYATAPL